MRTGIAGLVLGMVSSVLVGGPRATAQIATFENFSEGLVGASFVDPASGILFTNAIYNLPGGVFCIDYAGSTNSPDLPGNHLTGNVFSPGPALGLTTGFGFTFFLPDPSTYVQMDEIYFSDVGSSGFSISVDGYAPNGQRVLQASVLLPGVFPNIGVVHSEFLSATPISWVVVSTPSSCSVGFDNIGVPEPSLSLLALVGGVLAWGLYRRRTRACQPFTAPNCR